MNNEKIVMEFLGKYFDVSKVNKEDNIFELGFVNSLFAMQMVSFLENEFDFEISNDELNLDNFKSINSILAFIDSKSE
ncbi:MAG: acyl carrier protein [Ruminococcus sp.]|nr:acyl carrier protein [Ruminococcus sp.]